MAAATATVFARGDAAADALREAAAQADTGSFQQTDDVDLSEVRAYVSVAKARDVLPTLVEAVEGGCRVVMTAEESGSEVQIDLAAAGRSRIPVYGDVADLARELEDGDLGAACGAGDAAQVLALLATPSIAVELTMQAPAAGASWVRSAAELAGRLRDGRWAWTLRRIASRGHGAAAVIVVGDAGAEELRTGGLVIAGPAAQLRPTAPTPRTISTAYRSSTRRAGRPDIFEPAELTAQECADTLAPLSNALNGCAAAACWYWLSNSVSVDQDVVTLDFDGVRVVDLRLLPYAAATASAEVELAQWAMDTAEPTRADTVQQAITFAVRTQSDLRTAAKPVLRTARSLYDLATRGVVSEALAARRASRDAAVTAARSAATTAREVASKAVERSLAVGVAAAVALFANAQKFLTWGVTLAIVGTLAVLLGVALTVALRVDVPSGRGVVDAFDTDVEQYRDALSEDDVRSVKDLQALTSARTDLKRATYTAAWIYGGFLVLIISAGATVVSVGYSGGTVATTGTNAPTPTQTSPRGNGSPQSSPQASTAPLPASGTRSPKR